MICAASRALRIAQVALDALHAAEELAGLSFVCQMAHKALNLIAGDCLLPFDCGTVPLLTVRGYHARAVAALRFALDRLGRAHPLTEDAARVLHGVLFAVRAVLVALQAAPPVGHARLAAFAVA